MWSCMEKTELKVVGAWCASGKWELHDAPKSRLVGRGSTLVLLMSARTRSGKRVFRSNGQTRHFRHFIRHAYAAEIGLFDCDIGTVSLATSQSSARSVPLVGMSVDMLSQVVRRDSAQACLSEVASYERELRAVWAHPSA